MKTDAQLAEEAEYVQQAREAGRITDREAAVLLDEIRVQREALHRVR